MQLDYNNFFCDNWALVVKIWHHPQGKPEPAAVSSWKSQRQAKPFSELVGMNPPCQLELMKWQWGTEHGGTKTPLWMSGMFLGGERSSLFFQPMKHWEECCKKNDLERSLTVNCWLVGRGWAGRWHRSLWMAQPGDVLGSGGFTQVGGFCQGCSFLLYWRLSLVRAPQEAMGSGPVKLTGLDVHIHVTTCHDASSIFRPLSVLSLYIPHPAASPATTYTCHGTFHQRDRGNHTYHGKS